RNELPRGRGATAFRSAFLLPRFAFPPLSSPPMILCVGPTPTLQRTLVFDRLALDEVNRAASCDDYASGKAVNVARVAVMLGAESVVTGIAGGPRGVTLKEGVAADGVRHDFVKVDAQTRLCTTVIDNAKGTVTELVEESAAVDPGDYTDLFRVCTKWIHRKGARTVVLSGSLTPGGDLHLYPNVIDYVVGLGGRAILDARGPALRHALRCERFVVKLNRQELADTVGRRLATEAALKKAMREVCPAGGQVIVTMGKAGATAWDGEQFWRIPTPAVEAVNPIGSGDAFAAGLAVGLEQGLETSKVYALASACGAANALHPRAGHVAPGVVARLQKGIRVTAG
ncbi:MAG: tagatose-6-phosphate kinase, partial [Phycisphaerales bacterium]|nr:tagatose-6-phosphate kinase [Phycisphaerales bacterium]